MKRTRWNNRLATLAAVALVATACAAVLGTAPVGADHDACDRIAWSGEQGGQRRIFVSDDDGADRFAVSDVGSGSAPVLNDEPRWSPDGTLLTWIGTPGDRVRVLASNGDGTDRITVSRNTPFGTTPAEPRWSPDGERIVWTDRGREDIWISTADGRGSFDLSIVPPTPALSGEMSPEWSPDGTRVIWAADGGDLHLGSRHGGQRVIWSDLGPDPDPDTNVDPAWSPAGDRIAWSARKGASTQIYVADVDGGNRTTISDRPVLDLLANTNPVWSPDGTRIAWENDNGTTGEIWVASADGTNRRRVSGSGTGADPKGNANPVWSPDGTRIAWDATGTIHVADVDGSRRAAVSTGTAAPTGNRLPHWRPRPGLVNLGATTTPLTPGSTATVTITARTDCPTADIVIAGLLLPCVSVTGRQASPGSNVDADGTWTIPRLDGTATATFTGTVTGGGRCSGTVEVVSSLPAEPVRSQATIGDDCTTVPTPFTDIAGSFAKGDIACIYELGITKGTTATTYDPLGTVTREQMAAFLGRMWRTLGNACDFTPTPLVDAPASFAARDIACLYNAGITKGTTPTTYDAGADVTREQMAAFLARIWRADGGTCATTAPPFTDTGGSFAVDDIACIYDLGITKGKTATTYGPLLSVTREEMAAFLNRLHTSATT